MTGLSKILNRQWRDAILELETVILNRKKKMASRLLKIKTEELKVAPKQKWYAEYLALLAIRLDPALGKEYVAELMNWYNQNIKTDKRELAVLGMIQFIAPTELTISFNQHLWHKTMINDVRAIFTNQFPSVANYYDDDISDYWLKKQSARRQEKRKIRVLFVVHSNITCDKLLPVYEAMKRREEFEAHLVIHPDPQYKNPDGQFKYFYSKYPNDKVYDYLTLMDIRELEPDYVFFTNPYVSHSPFPSLRTNDIIKFAKICMVSYGASLAYIFPERLFESYRHAYKNIYMLFTSAETVKKIAQERFSQEYNHAEFLGYPALAAYYNIGKKKPSVAKRILWTPRWLTDDRWGGSHFMEYKDKFINLRERYGDKVELFFRPHMNLFKELIKQKTMTVEEVDAYKKSLKENRVTRPKLADMVKSIRNIDIFLADYSSILVCLFLTCRPIIYCEFPNAIPLPEYEEMFSAMYVARSWEEVEKYLDELISGNDPLLERRQEIAAKIYETHKDAADKIIDKLVEDFNRGVLNE